jgi:hypothetical protein
MSTRLFLLEDFAERSLSRLLQELGVHFEPQASLQEVFSGDNTNSNKKNVLILSGRHLNAARALARTRSVSLAQLFGNFTAVLLCAWEGEPENIRCLSEWIGGKVEVNRFQGDAHCYAVKPLALAKPFSGLEFGPVKTHSDFGLALAGTSCPVETIVSNGELSLFFRVMLPGTQLFVNCSSAIFDVDAEARHNLKAAQSFSALVPLLFFLRHCGISSWQTPLRAANIVIDDPDLQESYGFIETRTLARWVDKLDCAVSIGFIPWNFKRTSPSIVELFRSRWPRLSLCVHGCNHVEAEFCGNVSNARQVIALALKRMERLSRNTGLSYDKVMVFPRGEFSGSAMQALHESNFLAGVNTELIDSRADRGVPAGELLQPAITSYSGFPLFLRRPAREPIANFALDLLLGKPCLVGMHHDYFREGFERLAKLVNSLKGLDPGLSWSNLETIVSETYSVQTNAESHHDVRLYSRYTRVAIRKPPACISFCKSEPMKEKAFDASVNGHEIAASRNGQDFVFAAKVESQENVVRTRLSPVPTPSLPSYSLRYRLKVATRRHLARIRDNHVTGPGWKRLFWGVVRRISAKEKTLDEDPS